MFKKIIGYGAKEDASFVNKLTLELGIYHPSETFLMYGKEKVERAIEVYNKFYSKDAKEDIENYIIKEIL